MEERCKEQAYTMVNMMKMGGKEVFHNTDPKNKGEIRWWGQCKSNAHTCI